MQLSLRTLLLMFVAFGGWLAAWLHGGQLMGYAATFIGLLIFAHLIGAYYGATGERSGENQSSKSGHSASETRQSATRSYDDPDALKPPRSSHSEDEPSEDE